MAFDSSRSGLISRITSKIQNKLVLSFLAVSLIPLGVLAWVLQNQSTEVLKEQAFSQLNAVRTIKANQVKSYFDQIEKQIVTFSENRMVREAMAEFPQALEQARSENSVADADIERIQQELFSYYAEDFADEYGRRNEGAAPPLEDQFSLLDDDTVYLQSLYIKSNPNPLGEKEKLNRAEDSSQYSEMHNKYHPIVRSYLQKFGYYDIFLCDLESGDIVYSVFKELDFTTSLKDGPYSNTNFGRAFRMAAAANSPNDVFLVDYEPYTPSYEDAASFISSPIFHDGKKIGVAIFQMPLDRIDAIMAERTGLGETGETYAVGPDMLFRNESRFLPELGVESTIMNTSVKVDTEATRAAFRGESGSKVIDDYRGEPVLSSWTPITVHEARSGGESVTWALMSEFDEAEVRQLSVGTQVGTIVGLSVLGLVGVSLFISQNLTKQANSISDMLSMIGIGDFDARAEIVSNDELGQVALSLNSMCDNTLNLIQSAEERDQIETSIESLRLELEEIANGNLAVEAQVSEDVTGPIALSVNDMVQQLRDIIHRVKAATNEVSSSATEIQSTTTSLSRGSELQSTRIIDTSTAVKDMADSIQEVASKTEESAKVANDAREQAAKGAQSVAATVDGMNRIRSQVQETSKRIKRLGESSQEIGEIVQLISDIADRTSILALNASIQASMAGDAGQGFAVVAEEVERLAERSNDATKQIATLIKAIQTETTEAITGMEESTREVVEGSKLAAEAGQTLSQIDSVSNELAQLIESISLSAKQQARGAEAVSNSMIEISEVTKMTAEGTSDAAGSVSQLAELADELRGSVSRFSLPSFLSSNEDEEEERRLQEMLAEMAASEASDADFNSPASSESEAEFSEGSVSDLVSQFESDAESYTDSSTEAFSDSESVADEDQADFSHSEADEVSLG